MTKSIKSSKSASLSPIDTVSALALNPKVKPESGQNFDSRSTDSAVVMSKKINKTSRRRVDDEVSGQDVVQQTTIKYQAEASEQNSTQEIMHGVEDLVIDGTTSSDAGRDMFTFEEGSSSADYSSKPSSSIYQTADWMPSIEKNVDVFLAQATNGIVSDSAVGVGTAGAPSGAEVLGTAAASFESAGAIFAAAVFTAAAIDSSNSSVKKMVDSIAPTVKPGTATTTLVEDGGVFNGVKGIANSKITIVKTDEGDSNAAYFDVVAMMASGWSTGEIREAYTKVGTFGVATFSVVTGEVSYTLDNTKQATQALTAGSKVTDSFSIVVTDKAGNKATTNAVFFITGTKDAAVISGNSTASLTETNAILTATGTLTSTDVDGTDNQFSAQTDVVGNNGFGKFSITTGGVWTYTANTAHDEFKVGTTTRIPSPSQPLTAHSKSSR